MSFLLFIVASAVLWVVAIAVLLIVTIRNAQSPLLQQISGILSITPTAPQSATRAPDYSPPPAAAKPRTVRTNTDPQGPDLPQQSSYQRRFFVLGAYLDRQQRMFTAIWELNDGFLLQTVRTGSSQIAYLKVSDLQLNSLAKTPAAFIESQGPASELLASIGGKFDQRQASTIQVAVVGRSIVAGGLEPDSLRTHDVPGQGRTAFQPFQEVFAMPSGATE